MGTGSWGVQDVPVVNRSSGRRSTIITCCNVLLGNENHLSEDRAGETCGRRLLLWGRLLVVVVW